MALERDMLPDEKIHFLQRLLHLFYCFHAFEAIDNLEIIKKKRHVLRHKDGRTTMNSYKIQRLILCILFL